MTYIIELSHVNSKHIDSVGGKCASLGEMIQNISHKGIDVPNGFAVTVSAYKDFLSSNQIDTAIRNLLKPTVVKDKKKLVTACRKIRHLIMQGKFPKEFDALVTTAYKALNCDAVAVRSSATTEDLGTASFAGMQESYLNVRGVKAVINAIKLVYASLFTPRAILYRQEQGFDIFESHIAVGVQPMIRSDLSVSGVMFTLDPESGFDKVIVISASYGLGDNIVQGIVNTDEFIVYKPALRENKQAILKRTLGSKKNKGVYLAKGKAHQWTKTVPVPKKEQTIFALTDAEIHKLANYALTIEEHYGRPMDIEWAKNGANGEFYILQARPETVKSHQSDFQKINRYIMNEKSEVLAEGQAIGQSIGQGKARVILDANSRYNIKPGDVLVTDMTDPDWEPMMKIASAIVTNRGGRTCHAAIIARELGIPAVIGCTDATRRIKDGIDVTVSCAEGLKGYVYKGKLAYSKKEMAVENMPSIPLKVLLNIGTPDKAFDHQFLPNSGVGLARLEFIISNTIGIHPNAVLYYKNLPTKLKKIIADKTSAYASPVEFYIEKLKEGIAMIAAAFAPKEVIFRFSDFKTNEYANLIGGELFEPQEENPMIGFRGASRYVAKHFKEAFELECIAFKRIREEMGLTNAQVMIPFVRTVSELESVMALLETYKLARGSNGLKVYMMCEIPANVILAEEFLKHVDGFSIGSNDLTQLTLGLDRDSSLVANIFDERNGAVKGLLKKVIATCLAEGKYIGICGQGPSDHADFAKWLMQEGIESMSLNPDTIIETWLMLAELNKEKMH